MKVSTNIKTYIRNRIEELSDNVCARLQKEKSSWYKKLVKQDLELRKIYKDELEKFRATLQVRFTNEMPVGTEFVFNDYYRGESKNISLDDLLDTIAPSNTPVVTNANYKRICKAIHDLRMETDKAVNRVLVGLELGTIDVKDLDKEIAKSFDGYGELENQPQAKAA